VEFDEAAFAGKYGFEPAHMVDLKALMGDASDCIPGVPGIGEKTAMELIQKYKSLDAVYAGLVDEGFKPSVRAKLEAGRDKAYLSYALAKINKEAPLPFDPAENLVKAPDNDKLYRLFTRLEFAKLSEAYGLVPPAEKPASAGERADIVWLEAEAETVLRDCEASARVYYACDRALSALAVIASAGAYTLVRPDLSFLRAFFSDKVKKAGHDVKALMRRLLDLNIPFGGFVCDTALASYLLNPSESGYDLPRCMKRLLGRDLASAENAGGDGLSFMDDGSALDTLKTPAAAGEALCDYSLPLLSEQGMDELFNKIELPLCPVLAEMEHRGVAVDREALRQYGRARGDGIDALTKEIYALAGGEFNISSPKQLGALLFDRLRLPPYGKTKTG